jgi:hypothetical protein
MAVQDDYIVPMGWKITSAEGVAFQSGSTLLIGGNPQGGCQVVWFNPENDLAYIPQVLAVQDPTGGTILAGTVKVTFPASPPIDCEVSFSLSDEGTLRGGVTPILGTSVPTAGTFGAQANPD